MNKNKIKKMLAGLDPVPSAAEAEIICTIVDELTRDADPGSAQVDVVRLQHIFDTHRILIQYNFFSDSAGPQAAVLIRQGHDAVAQGLYGQATECFLAALTAFGVSEQTPSGEIALLPDATYNTPENIAGRKYAAALLLAELAELALARHDIWGAISYLHSQLEYLDQTELELRLKSCHLLADLYRIQERHQQACEFYQQAVEHGVKLYGRSETINIINTVNLALSYADLKELGPARKWLEDALELIVATKGQTGIDIRDLLESLAGICADAGDLAAAIDYQEQVLELYQEYITDDPGQYADYANNLAEMYDEAEQPDQAQAVLNETIDKLETEHGHLPAEAAFLLNNLAWLIAVEERFEEACDLLDYALSLSQEDEQADDETVATRLTNLGIMEIKCGYFDEALEHLQNALEIYQEFGSEFSEEIGDVNFEIAHCYYAMGNFKDAVKPLEYAITIFQNISHDEGSEHPQLQEALEHMADIKSRL